MPTMETNAIRKLREEMVLHHTGNLLSIPVAIETEVKVELPQSDDLFELAMESAMEEMDKDEPRVEPFVTKLICHARQQGKTLKAKQVMEEFTYQDKDGCLIVGNRNADVQPHRPR